MLDTYYQSKLPSSIIVNGRTTVNEHRAPTDESVALLMQMEDKIKERLIKCVWCDDNTIRFKGIVWEDFLGVNAEIKIELVVNGNKIYGVVRVPYPAKDEDYFTAIRDFLAKQIANYIVIENFKSLKP